MLGLGVEQGVDPLLELLGHAGERAARWRRAGANGEPAGGPKPPIRRHLLAVVVPSSSATSSASSTGGQHLAVAGLVGQQPLVGVEGEHPAALDERDPVGEGDGRQPVGDDDGGAIGGQPLDGLVDLGLDPHVDRAGGVVEDQDRGVGEQRAGDGDALPLAARERVAPLADDRVVALGQVGDEAVGVGRLGRGDDLVDGWRRGGRRRCCRGSTPRTGTARR